MPQKSLDRLRAEEIGGVFHLTEQALMVFRHLQREIELRCAGRYGFAPRLDAGKRERRGRLLPGEHDLKQRCHAKIAPRLEFLDQSLERHDPMLVCLQRHVTHAPQQLPERRIAAQVGSQHQRVHEEPDDVLHLGAGPIGDWRPNRDVRLPGTAREQRLKRGEQQHEECRPVRTREGDDLPR